MKKCTFCKNKSTLTADFISVDNERTEISACKKHYQLAFIKQQQISDREREREENKLRIERIKNPYPYFTPNL